MPMSLWLDALGRDLKFTRRVLTKNFAFTATAIVTLALGIAASTVIYTVVDAVLLQPLDYNDSGDIYRVYTVDTVGLPRGTTGGPHMHPIAEEGELIQAAIYGYSFEQSVVNDEGTPFAVSEFRTSDEFFDVFTEPLLMGREFEPREDYRNTILSYQTWRDVFGSDPNILGKPINVGSGPLTVIGVAAQGFEFPVGTAMWTKIFTLPEGQPLPLLNLSGYVRVQPGVSAAQAQAELDVFAGRLAPWPDGRKVELVARPLLEDVVGDLRPTLFIVSGATAVLLLIACINVANLLLARGVVRASEFALREASGARRWRMFRQLMTESLVLCTVGGVLGLALALGAIELLQAVGPADLPRFGTLSIDANVFVFAAACVLLVAFGVGLAPALRVSRGDLSALIGSGGRSAALARGRNRMFGSLVIAEIALAVVLVIGAGLLVRSFSELSSADPGFDPRRMVTLVLNVTGRTEVRNMRMDQERQAVVYDGTGMLGVAQFYQELIRRIDALPGVASAGAVFAAPLNHGLFPIVLWPYPVVGSGADATNQLAYVFPVSPEFFTTFGIRPLAGRLLEPTDRRGAAGVTVVNEAYACVSRGAKSHRPPYRAPRRKLASGSVRVRSDRRANRRRGRDRRRDSEHQAGQPPGRRATGRLPSARATDDAQDGDHRPLGDGRSRRADSGDSPRARGNGLDDSRRLRRLLGRRLCVAGATAARRRRARRVRRGVADTGRSRHVRPDVVLGESAVQRDCRAVGVWRGARQTSEDVHHARVAAGRHRHRSRHRRCNRAAAGRREPALRDERARSVGARARSADDARRDTGRVVRAGAPRVAHRR